MRIHVIGAGIAGLATAIALHREGIAATVSERHPGTADDVGSWLQVASNGVAALHAIGLGPVVEAVGIPTARLRTVAPDGRVSGEMPLGQQPGRGLATRSVRRAHLYRLLRTEAERLGITVEHGVQVVGVEERGDVVGVVTASGERREADLVIGADGVRSAVRRQRGAGDEAVPLPDLVNIGGSAATDRLPADAVPPMGTLQFRFGRDCFVGSVQGDDGATWWFANPRLDAVPGGAVAAAALTNDTWTTVLTRLAAPDGLPVAALLAASGPVDVWADVATTREVDWGHGRVVLVGDAAHAIPPSSGQGASLALEDAVVLAGLLAADPDPAGLVTRFATARGSRVAAVSRQGAQLDRSKVLGPVGAAVRDRVVLPLAALQARRTGTTPASWMYDFPPRR